MDLKEKRRRMLDLSDCAASAAVAVDLGHDTFANGDDDRVALAVTAIPTVADNVFHAMLKQKMAGMRIEACGFPSCKGRECAARCCDRRACPSTCGEDAGSTEALSIGPDDFGLESVRAIRRAADAAVQGVKAGRDNSEYADSLVNAILAAPKIASAMAARVKLGEFRSAFPGISATQLFDFSYSTLERRIAALSPARATPYRAQRIQAGIEAADAGRLIPLEEMEAKFGIGSEKHMAVEGYEALASVLYRAFDQASAGKGKERHANGQAFHEQRMQLISQLVGSPDGMSYQACKKIVEGIDLPTLDRQVHELLGAIVYIAGIVVYLENRDAQAKREEKKQ